MEFAFIFGKQFIRAIVLSCPPQDVPHKSLRRRSQGARRIQAIALERLDSTKGGMRKR
jgi:hypothetical protein